jgi:heme A synthase
VTTLTYINTFFSLLIILTGALVRGSGATLACTDWPLCVNNSLLPLEYGQLAVIHMLHRFAVAAFGITLAILVWQIMRTRQDGFVRMLAWLALLTFALQAAIGALYVLSVAAPIWGAAHVGMAATNWSVLVILSTVEAMNTQHLFKHKNNTGTSWNPQSEAL